MNRLILLGNGFDLAHGLPTSYNDFILWYLNDFIEKAVKTGRYRDELMEVEIRYSISSQTNGRHTNKTLISYFYKRGFDTLFEKKELMIVGEGPGILNPYVFSNVSPLLNA